MIAVSCIFFSRSEGLANRSSNNYDRVFCDPNIDLHRIFLDGVRSTNSIISFLSKAVLEILS